MVEWRVNRHFENRLCYRHQFPSDKNRNGSQNIRCCLTIWHCCYPPTPLKKKVVICFKCSQYFLISCFDILTQKFLPLVVYVLWQHSWMHSLYMQNWYWQNISIILSIKFSLLSVFFCKVFQVTLHNHDYLSSLKEFERII